MFLSKRASQDNDKYDKHDLFAKMLLQWMASFEHRYFSAFWSLCFSDEKANSQRQFQFYHILKADWAITVDDLSYKIHRSNFHWLFSS